MKPVDPWRKRRGHISIREVLIEALLLGKDEAQAITYCRHRLDLPNVSDKTLAEYYQLTRNTLVMTKRIEKAAASSVHAANFGFKTVCYVIEIVDGDHIGHGTGIAATATLQEAKDYADKLPIPYNKRTM